MYRGRYIDIVQLSTNEHNTEKARSRVTSKSTGFHLRIIMGNTKYPYENESVFNSSELPGEEVGEWGGGCMLRFCGL